MPEKYDKLQNLREKNPGRKEKDTDGIYPQRAHRPFDLLRRESAFV